MRNLPSRKEFWYFFLYSLSTTTNDSVRLVSDLLGRMPPRLLDVSSSPFFDDPVVLTADATAAADGAAAVAAFDSVCLNSCNDLALVKLPRLLIRSRGSSSSLLTSVVGFRESAVSQSSRSISKRFVDSLTLSQASDMLLSEPDLLRAKENSHDKMMLLNELANTRLVVAFQSFLFN